MEGGRGEKGERAGEGQKRGDTQRARRGANMTNPVWVTHNRGQSHWRIVISQVEHQSKYFRSYQIFGGNFYLHKLVCTRSETYLSLPSSLTM